MKIYNRIIIFLIILFAVFLTSCANKKYEVFHCPSPGPITIEEVIPQPSTNVPELIDRQPIMDTSEQETTNDNIDTPKEKKPFKQLYKYVTDEEISSMDTIIKDVPLIGQFPDYPTGCESVAAVNLMNYYGINISIDDFINEKLNKDISFSFSGGKMYGPSPYEYFLGDPRSENSWGCMAPVIADAMAKCTDTEQIISFTDKSLEELCELYVSRGVPALVWVSIHMLDISYTSSWYIDEETVFHWPNNEHCMILVGYDDWYYYFNDPYVPAIVRYKKEFAQDRFDKLGMQSIIIEKSNDNQVQ